MFVAVSAQAACNVAKAKAMERPPPLRFGAKALADAKATQRQTLSRIGKHNVRGRPNPFPHSFKPKPEQKEVFDAKEDQVGTEFTSP